MKGDVYFKAPNGAAHYTIEEDDVDISARLRDDEVVLKVRFSRRGKEGEIRIDKDDFFDKVESSYFDRNR